LQKLVHHRYSNRANYVLFRNSSFFTIAEVYATALFFNLLNYFNFRLRTRRYFCHMKNIKETVELYTKAWNEETAAAVKLAFAQILADEITYQDKHTPLVKGIDAFVDLVMSSYEKVPGRSFSLLTEPEYFDHHCYYAWSIKIPGNGEFTGRDYVEYNDENKMTKIIGFVPTL